MAADDSDGLAFLGTNPPEVKPSPTPIFGPGPDKTVDTIPPNEGKSSGDQVPEQQPPKPYQTPVDDSKQNPTQYQLPSEEASQSPSNQTDKESTAGKMQKQ